MDLSKIRLLRDDVKIWLVYAGYRRRFFDDFKNNGCVFLNIPGFDASIAAFRDDDLMRKHLAMSDQIARFNLGSRPLPPSRNPRDYSSFPYDKGSTEARSFSAELGNISRLFLQAEVGDLVISPSNGHFEPFLIGEICKVWSKEDDLAVPKLGEEFVPTRRIKWLNVALARRDFPARTSRRLQNRHAITLLDENYYEDIFDNVYPSYAWGERSKLDLFGNGYLGKDPLQPYQAAALLKYVLASAFAFDKGEIEQFQTLSIEEAITKFYDETLVEDLYQNFNSPGKFSVIATLGTLSILTAAGLLVATSEPSGNFAQQKNEVSTQIEQSLQGPGKQDAIRETENYLNSLEAIPWKRIQKDVGVPAKNSLGLTLDNSVEVANHRAELNAN